MDAVVRTIFCSKLWCAAEGTMRTRARDEERSAKRVDGGWGVHAEQHVLYNTCAYYLFIFILRPVRCTVWKWKTKHYTRHVNNICARGPFSAQSTKATNARTDSGWACQRNKENTSPSPPLPTTIQKSTDWPCGRSPKTLCIVVNTPERNVCIRDGRTAVSMGIAGGPVKWAVVSRDWGVRVYQHFGHRTCLISSLNFRRHVDIIIILLSEDVSIRLPGQPVHCWKYNGRHNYWASST